MTDVRAGGSLWGLPAAWREEAKHEDREAGHAFGTASGTSYHTAVNRRRVYTKCADELHTELSALASVLAQIEQEMRKEIGRSDPERIVVDGRRVMYWAKKLAALRGGK